MIIGKGQIFNLWDTNGRRADVLNALRIYLDILKENKESFPEDMWDTYPSSLAQYRFYEEAILRSPDVFKKHDKRDCFTKWLSGGKEAQFMRKDSRWFAAHRNDSCSNKTMAEILDESIEQRARHYSSNLVKWGFANDNRDITPAGFAFMSGKATRDELETLLPIDDTNLNLLRQAVKLRVYANAVNSNGKYVYYSPFFMALHILMSGKNYSTNEFKTIVQQTSPFHKDKYNLSEIINGISIKKELSNIPIPFEIDVDEKLCPQVYKNFFSNTKSGNVVAAYYSFYELIIKIHNGDEMAIADLASLQNEYQSQLSQAFGCGSRPFEANSEMSMEDFLDANLDNELLEVQTIQQLNRTLYRVFMRSKFIDQAREYSDTTLRMLNATGLFSFSTMPEVHFPLVIKTIFGDNVEQLIFGECTTDDRDAFEHRFCQSLSLQEILSITSSEVLANIDSLCRSQNVLRADLPGLLKNQKDEEFMQHIEEKYPKGKIIELLLMFSNRANDEKIKKYVNPAATVPTIYEFVVAIAWYYISGNYSLYDSLNLSLNGDYEPELHAGGGEGDIVINKSSQTTMIEVTLMNKQAQKRGEWEPVLRHAVNLTVEKAPIPVITLFVADELDYNTINIWRAVTMIPLESSATGQRTSKVIIMPFTNSDIVTFLEQDKKADTILSVVKSSYDSLQMNFDDQWRDGIINQIMTN